MDQVGRKPALVAESTLSKKSTDVDYKNTAISMLNLNKIHYNIITRNKGQCLNALHIKTDNVNNEQINLFRIYAYAKVQKLFFLKKKKKTFLISRDSLFDQK